MDRNTESIQVASRNVGRIIGARGSKIAEIQKNSQARIQISREETDDGQRTVELNGSKEQIEKAKMLIEQCVNDSNRGGFSNRGSGFGGGGQRGRRDYKDEGRSSWRDRRNNDQDESWGGRNNGTNDSWGGRNNDRNESWGESNNDRNDSWGGRSNDRNELWGGRNNGTNDSWGGRNNGTNDLWGGRSNDRKESWGGRNNGTNDSWGETNDRNDSWGGKSNATNDSWGGKSNATNNSWGGKSNATNNSWGGKSNATNDSWGGRSNGRNEPRGGRHNDRNEPWGGRNNDRKNGWGGRDNGYGDQWENNQTESAHDEWKEDISDSSRGYKNEGRNDWGRKRGGAKGGFSRGPRESRDGGGNREEVYVLSMEVGRLIGQGGSKIKELQSESNCRIKVSREAPNAVNTVELIGSSEQIEEAKKLISKTVDIVNRDGTRQADETAASEEQPAEVMRRVPIDWSSVYKSSQERTKEKFKDLPPIIKQFYDELEDIANLPREEISLIRKENNNIIVECPDNDDGSFPNPIKVFEDAFHNYPLILEQIYKQKFVKPSPIQCQSWPVLLQGKDLIGIAQTGTGKTLAFLLPALIHIDNQPVPREERTGPSALILSPTRELAQQIEMEVNKINYKGIRSICVYGGGDRREQMAKCKKGVEIVVATPGRLNDFMMNGVIDVTNVTYLVMDEADRMLDLGFELEIKKVMIDIRPDRQTVMTSATWPDEVQHLADSYMTDPYKVFVGTLDLAAVHSVKQHVEICQDYEKKDMILEFIEQMGPTDKVIIFVGKKIIADDLSSDLAMANIVCQCIHGDREQCDREAALSEFKSSVVRILVATDVASRGLDVPDITHVINYDFPRHIEEYVHRIGRTGRAGRSGIAITFVTRGDWKSVQQLIDIMTEANQEIPDDLVSMAERYTSFKQRRHEEGFVPGMRGRGRGRGRGGRGRRCDDEDTFFM